MRRVGILFTAVALLTPGIIGAVAAPAHATTLPGLTVGDTTVWEGDAGTAVVTVPVDLSSPSATKVTVLYAITSDSATLGSDFTAASGKLTFAKNIATKTLKVTVKGDTTPEADEHLSITLSQPVGATLEKNTGSVTIMDDDSDGVGSGVEVNVGDVTVVEANAGIHKATIPVTLSRPSLTPIKITYAIQCSTADADDYRMGAKGTITFAKNQQTKYLTFTVLPDAVPESLVKSIVQSIKVAKGPAVVGQGVGEGLIVDNDGDDPSTPPNGGALLPDEIRRMSVADDGSEANPVAPVCGLMQSQLYGSRSEVISADGLHVAFASDADNLVPGDTNANIHVFVRDLVSGTTERVSVQNDGSEFPPAFSVNEAQTSIGEPAISADGRYVTFTNHKDGQLYLRDRVAETTELITVPPAGADQWYYKPRISSISADGRFVAFDSVDEHNYAPPTPNYPNALYVRDRLLGTTTQIASLPLPQGASDWADFGGPTISGNGRYVAYNAFSPSAVVGTTHGCADTFVVDRATGTTEQVSVNSAGVAQSIGQYGSCSFARPLISYDGRYVGFSSAGVGLSALLSGTNVQHAFIHDRVTGTTELVDDSKTLNPRNETSQLYGMSDDARYVSWLCLCGDPIPSQSISPDIVTMWTDRATGETKEIGDQADGTVPVDEDSGWFTFTYAVGGLSADGLTTAFESHATNLVPDDTNGVWDVFVQRMR